jgi:uncharacterized protein YggU (UPF0235/DUF167 family)
VTPGRAQVWRSDPAGVRLLVRVTPKSTREGVDGLADTAHGKALTVRVRAAADKGEANRAVEMVVAQWLGVAKSSVAVCAGGKSRVKTLRIEGDPARLGLVLGEHVGKLQ